MNYGNNYRKKKQPLTSQSVVARDNSYKLFSLTKKKLKCA